MGDRARCYLALQRQAVAGSILERFGDDVRARLAPDAEPVEPELIAELVDVSDGRVTLDEEHRDKQPDWSFDEEYSGKSPAGLYADHRAEIETSGAV